MGGVGGPLGLLKTTYVSPSNELNLPLMGGIASRVRILKTEYLWWGVRSARWVKKKPPFGGKIRERKLIATSTLNRIVKPPIVCRR